MKVVILLLFICCGQLAANVKAQGQKIDLHVEHKSLVEVMDMLKLKSGFSFIYSAEDVEKVTGITVNVMKKSVDEILQVILKGTDLTYKVEGNLIVLKKILKEKNEDKRRLVTGVVLDMGRDTLPGVNVLIKGTSVGVVTDQHGKYSLYLPEGDDVIVLCFTFIGKRQKEIKYTGQKVINVILEDENLEMEEVVVTGYQKIDKRHLTSAVTTIRAEDILMPGVSTIDKMLEGHVPGMIFMQNSGQVGATPRMRIRGTSTILGTQEPLWVVDGIIQTDPVNLSPDQINDLDFVNLLGNAIGGLNPNDIEQIDILKDASATALYGTRAANGVIVITTKKGKPGPPSITYNVSGSYSRRPRYTDRAVNMMNSVERIDFSREIIEKGLENMLIDSWVGYEGAMIDYMKGKINFEEFQRQVSLYESVNTDWFDIICRDAFSHSHTLSLSGGSSNVRYYASVRYNKENGVLRKESGDQYNANVKVTLNQGNFTGSFSLNGNIRESKYTPSELKLLDYAYNTTRALPAYNEDGSLWFYDKNALYSQTFLPFNILHERDESYNTIDGSGMTFNMQLGYTFFKALKAEFTLGYTVNDTEQETYYSEDSFYATDLRYERNGKPDEEHSILPYGGELRMDNTENRSLTLRGQLNFNKFIDKNNVHLLSIAVGGEASSTKYEGYSQTRRGYLPERGLLFSQVDVGKYPVYGSWLATDAGALGKRKEQITNMVSGYATISYSYKNDFTLNTNMRIDASNKFGNKSNDKLLPIWSVSGVWNMKENILKNVRGLDMLSLRASFGFQGNMLDNVTPELVIKQGGIHPVFEEYESTVYSFPNPYLKWEKTASFNTSLDFSFFNKKIRGSLSYYYKKTKDAFLTKNISIVNGVNTYTVNKGTLENQGFDISFNFIPVNTLSGGNAKGFRWICDPQIGQVLNKLLDKAVEGKNQVLHDTYKYSDYLDGKVQVVGRPLNSFYSYTFEGLSPEDGSPMFARTDETETFDKYALMEDKQEVFRTVMEHSGVRVPFIQGGINNTFSYDRFTLTMNLAYSIGSKVRLLKLYGEDFYMVYSIAPAPNSNVRREFVNRWRGKGDEKYTNIPGLLPNAEFMKTLEPWWKEESFAFADNIWQMYDNANIRVVSGNYLKLQHLALRYTFSNELCKKLHVQQLSMSLSGTNLFTWSHKALKGQDPTSQSGSAKQINLSIRPTYTLNLNVTF